MSDNAILANSIWPNGIKVDADGHAVFYPLGTNKIEVPSENEWPKGDTLVSPFVYEDGLLVGFVDTKAMTVSGNTTITLPYEHIDADFSSILQGDLTVNAPNAGYKNFIWAVVAGEGGEGGVEINFKYKGCTTAGQVKAKDANYLTTDIVDGVWSESLADLENGYMLFTSFGDDCSLYPEVKNLIEFNGDLSSLTHAHSMFNGCQNLTTFTSDLPNLTDGSNMFSGASLTSFDIELPKLTNGNQMFWGNNFTTFSSDLSNLTDGTSMFGSTNLTSFSSELPNLTNGQSMFSSCTNLTSFDIELPKLGYGKYMFSNCPNLTSFDIELSYLTSGESMFETCPNLTSFSSDLSEMYYGYKMFNGCSNLTSFTSDLSKLTNGYHMFRGCNLDTASIQHIASTIKDVNSLTSSNYYYDRVYTYIYIDTVTPLNSDKVSAFEAIEDKGWAVLVNGAPLVCAASTMTLDENGEETVVPIPFYAKPIPSDEEHAEYVDAEGNFFNILGGQYIFGDDLSTYGMFTSEEDAAANMRLTKIGAEKIETA